MHPSLHNIIAQYDTRQHRLEPFLASSSAASTVYEQLAIQKAYIEILDVNDLSALTMESMESLTVQVRIAQDTILKVDRFLEVLAATSKMEQTRC